MVSGLENRDGEKRVISLCPYRNQGSLVYTGHSRGEEVRHLLMLDELDKESGLIEFLIPAGTVAFNASFFLGMLEHSIRKLGKEAFQNKYSFTFEEVAPRSIIAQLVEGKRQAQNGLYYKPLL